MNMFDGTELMFDLRGIDCCYILFPAHRENGCNTLWPDRQPLNSDKPSASPSTQLCSSAYSIGHSQISQHDEQSKLEGDQKKGMRPEEGEGGLVACMYASCDENVFGMFGIPFLNRDASSIPSSSQQTRRMHVHNKHTPHIDAHTTMLRRLSGETFVRSTNTE